jgi:hypothetical protein
MKHNQKIRRNIAFPGPLYPNDTCILLSREGALLPSLEYHRDADLKQIIEGQITETDRGGVIVSTVPDVWRAFAYAALKLADELEEAIKEERWAEAAGDEMESAISDHESHLFEQMQIDDQRPEDRIPTLRRHLQDAFLKQIRGGIL